MDAGDIVVAELTSAADGDLMIPWSWPWWSSEGDGAAGSGVASFLHTPLESAV
jgi:hypothetical protein